MERKTRLLGEDVLAINPTPDISKRIKAEISIIYVDNPETVRLGPIIPIVVGQDADRIIPVLKRRFNSSRRRRIIMREDTDALVLDTNALVLNKPLNRKQVQRIIELGYPKFHVVTNDIRDYLLFVNPRMPIILTGPYKQNFLDLKDVKDHPIISLVGEEYFNIYGPNSYYIFEQRDLPSLLLFGEYHTELRKKCGDVKDEIAVDEWLWRLIEQNPDKLFDIYLEKEIPSLFMKERRKGSSGAFELLQRRFERCLPMYEYKGCPKNVRLHYTDVRSLFVSIYDVPDRINAIKKNNYRLPDKEVSKLQDLIDKILKRVPEAFIDEYTFMNKELSRMDQDITLANGEPLVKYLRRESYEALALYNYLVDLLHDLQVELNTLPRDEDGLLIINETVMRYLNDIIMLMLSPAILDIYTIARMFRTFQNAPPPRNIIFYGGFAHTVNIAKIMKLLYGKLSAKYRGRGQCVKLLYNIDRLFT